MSLVERFCQASRGATLALFITVILSACATQGTRNAGNPSDSTPAETPIKPAAQLPEVDLTPALLYEILVSEIALQRNDKKLAMVALVDATRKTGDPRLAERATRLAVLNGEFDTAIEMAELWVKKDPDDADVHQTLGNLYVVVKKLDQAIPHYHKSLELTTPAHADMLLQNITDTLVRYSSNSEALDTMQKLVDSFPDSASVHLAYAKLAGMTGHRDLAGPAVDKALALKPDWETAAIYKFRLLLSLQKPDQAIQFAHRFLKKHEKAIALRSGLARYYIENDQYKEAEKEYSQIFKQKPDSSGAVLALALLRIQANDLDKAKKYLDTVLKLDQRNDLARIYLGEIATSEGKLDEAEQWLRSVTDPDQLFSARVRLASVINKRDGIDAALRELEAVHPETPAQQSELALIRNEMLVGAGRYQEAYDALDRVIEEQPDNIELLYARGMVASDLKDVAGLEKDMRRVLELNPGHAHALNALGYTLADQTERIDEAERLIKQALDKRPDDPFILDSYGWVKYRQGQLKEAEKYLRQALAGRNDPEIAAHLVEVLWKLNKRKEARQILEKANKDFPGNELLGEVSNKLLGH